jgi:hypothetical protein
MACKEGLSPKRLAQQEKTKLTTGRSLNHLSEIAFVNGKDP